MFYETMVAEYKRLEEKIFSLQEQINALPEGKLLCSHNNQYIKWYHRNNNQLSYIPKRNSSLTEKLALKKYLTFKQEHLLEEKNAMDSYFEKYNQSQDKSILLLNEDSDYVKLLTPHFQTFSDDSATWSNTPYEKNPNYPEQLIHKTFSGHMVRSKSEVMIDMMLYQCKIPFRYECAFYLGDSVLYPDFMIRHPHDGKIIIWEHFGMMDDPTYYQKTLSKLQFYISHGIIPSINLITTFESKNNPLSAEYIEKVIQFYFQ